MSPRCSPTPPSIKNCSTRPPTIIFSATNREFFPFEHRSEACCPAFAESAIRPTGRRIGAIAPHLHAGWL
jgi:hypothetical protein